MKKLFDKIKSVLRVFRALKNLWNSIKSGIALLKMPLAGWALVLVAAFVIYSVVTDYQALRKAIDYMQTAFSSPGAQVVAPPGIKTSVTKDVPIPPRYVANRMPKDAKGNKSDSLTCGMVYKYDEKEAFASVGVAYKFNIDAFNEFYQRADNIHTNIMDATWKKISPLSTEETGRSFYSYEGYPLLFTRENQALSTVDHAVMTFAVDYYVQFTVFEKPK